MQTICDTSAETTWVRATIVFIGMHGGEPLYLTHAFYNVFFFIKISDAEEKYCAKIPGISEIHGYIIVDICLLRLCIY
jgi:hypothetical protein